MQWQRIRIANSAMARRALLSMESCRYIFSQEKSHCPLSSWELSWVCWFPNIGWHCLLPVVLSPLPMQISVCISTLLSHWANWWEKKSTALDVRLQAQYLSEIKRDQVNKNWGNHTKLHKKSTSTEWRGYPPQRTVTASLCWRVPSQMGATKYLPREGQYNEWF